MKVFVEDANDVSVGYLSDGDVSGHQFSRYVACNCEVVMICG